jgi:cellulose synthase/poly-beta-1,6-N-acetylglucosamine synthase-like glycosyltransferase
LCAIRKASGDILVFSDVATRIPADALRILALQFNNPSIGALSSEDRFVSKNGLVVGEGAYVRYEMWLRRLESDRAGLVGLSGSFFAARREICEQWDIYSPSDFNTALNCAKKGLVAITCPDVVGFYSDVKNPGLEYRRKIRTVVRGMTAISRHPEVLNPVKMGLFAFQIWSHKIMRWGVPWFLLLFATSNLALADEGLVYRIVLMLQFIFYGLAAIGWMSGSLRKNTAVRIIFFFVQTNLALAYALLSFLAGKRMTVWTPSQR